jgi:hypothetical protein
VHRQLGNPFAQRRIGGTQLPLGHFLPVSGDATLGRPPLAHTGCAGSATRAALAAIDRYDPMVNAFVLVDADGAMAAAKASEARWHAARPLGPADGVPTSIKDALWTRG